MTIKESTTSENGELQIVSQFIRNKYPNIYRKKTWCEVFMVSAGVMGIEFAYSAETAFVTPTLLELGLKHENMTMVWALSPLLGFFLGPILGTVSDRCTLSLGRRRPLIICLAFGIFLGLLFIPYGKEIGLFLGDDVNISSKSSESTEKVPKLPIIAIIFTIIGCILMDFDSDVCQSVVRAYILEVTIFDDHSKCLSTCTVMAGLGGFMGYALSGINWNALVIGNYFGGNVKTVFLIITIFFVSCITITVLSFKEIPLNLILNTETKKNAKEIKFTNKTADIECVKTDENEELSNMLENSNGEEVKSFLQYLKIIVLMPSSMKVLYITNLFSWISHLSYALYFTDFVGEIVFEGDPKAVDGSIELENYNNGVRFGCLGMAIYSLSCAIYSAVIKVLMKTFGTKFTYCGSFIIYSLGMTALALLKTPWAALVFSITAGIAYSTLFIIPYIIIASYHTNGVFKESDRNNINKLNKRRQRGLGADISMIGSTVFVAQLILSLSLGWLVDMIGTVSVIVWTAAIFAAFAAISATQVTYLL